MPRAILSGPVHEIEVNRQFLTFCDGAFVGDRPTISALQKRLAGIDQPTIADVESAATALCARRGESYAGCSCAACTTATEAEAE